MATKKTEASKLEKVIISKLKPLKEKVIHKLHLSPGEGKIRVNLSRKELAFFREKWSVKTKRHTKESFINFLNLYGAIGIDADMPLDEFPEGHIRRIKAVSNSRLTRLKDELQGKTYKPIGRKGVFGSCFHEFVLERKIYDLHKYNLRPSEIKHLEEMKKALKADTLTQKILKREGNNMEVTRIWTDEKTGLKCKGKLDIEIPELEEATDLKTTAARNQKEFNEMAHEYEYDRQGAFYATGAKAKRFRIIGVQKIAPYNVYHFLFDRDSDFMRNGKRKVDFLLRKYKEHRLS